jgi:hypothetical protein
MLSKLTSQPVKDHLTARTSRLCNTQSLAGSCESNTDAPTGLLRTKDSTAA